MSLASQYMKEYDDFYIKLLKMYKSKYNFVIWKIFELNIWDFELNIMGYSGCNPYGTVTIGG